MRVSDTECCSTFWPRQQDHALACKSRLGQKAGVPQGCAEWMCSRGGSGAPAARYGEGREAHAVVAAPLELVEDGAGALLHHDGAPAASSNASRRQRCSRCINVIPEIVTATSPRPAASDSRRLKVFLLNLLTTVGRAVKCEMRTSRRATASARSRSASAARRRPGTGTAPRCWGLQTRRNRGIQRQRHSKGATYDIQMATMHCAALRRPDAQLLCLTKEVGLVGQLQVHICGGKTQRHYNKPALDTVCTRGAGTPGAGMPARCAHMQSMLAWRRGLTDEILRVRPCVVDQRPAGDCAA